MILWRRNVIPEHPEPSFLEGFFFGMRERLDQAL